MRRIWDVPVEPHASHIRHLMIQLLLVNIDGKIVFERRCLLKLRHAPNHSRQTLGIFRSKLESLLHQLNALKRQQQL